LARPNTLTRNGRSRESWFKTDPPFFDGDFLGIGRIGGSACESMARQPEMAAKIQTAMIISAALIEGAAFFALLLVLIK